MKILIKVTENRCIEDALNIFQEKAYDFFKENAFSLMKFHLVGLIVNKPKNQSDVCHYFQSQYPNISFKERDNLVSHFRRIIFTEMSAPKISIEKNGILILSDVQDIQSFFNDYIPFVDYEIINDSKDYNWILHNSYIAQLRKYGEILNEFSNRLQESKDFITMVESYYDIQLNDIYSFILNENEQFYKKESI